METTELDKLMTAWGETLVEYDRMKVILEECDTQYFEANLKEYEAIERRLMTINTEIRRIQE